MMPNIGAIAKWAAIAAFIAMIGVVFNAFEAKGELQGKLDKEVATVERMNAEVKTANNQLDNALTRTKERESEFLRKAKLAEKYKRRALYAERELGKLVGGGDVDAINRRVCETYDRIEGNNSDGRKARCDAYLASSDASSTYFKVSSISLENNLTNLERIATVFDLCFMPYDVYANANM
ncbi:MAG: hypothetical protein Q9M11_07115 [Mariprofundaceae bacterium]|nr:hypothetical protein [Mariprofundaceae bacterium]